MKNRIKVIGIIVLLAVIGLTMIACGSSPSSGSSARSSAGTIRSVTITGIPAQYNNRFIMLTLDTGGRGARNVAWGTYTISGNSATFNLLDWVTDQPTAIREGNYGVNIIIAANMSAIANDQHDYVGIIMSRALSGEAISIAWGEFISP